MAAVGRPKIKEREFYYQPSTPGWIGSAPIVGRLWAKAGPFEEHHPYPLNGDRFFKPTNPSSITTPNPIPSFHSPLIQAKEKQKFAKLADEKKEQLKLQLTYYSHAASMLYLIGAMQEFTSDRHVLIAQIVDDMMMGRSLYSSIVNRAPAAREGFSISFHKKCVLLIASNCLVRLFFHKLISDATEKLVHTFREEMHDEKKRETLLTDLLKHVTIFTKEYLRIINEYKEHDKDEQTRDSFLSQKLKQNPQFYRASVKYLIDNFVKISLLGKIVASFINNEQLETAFPTAIQSGLDVMQKPKIDADGKLTFIPQKIFTHNMNQAFLLMMANIEKLLDEALAKQEDKSTNDQPNPVLSNDLLMKELENLSEILLKLAPVEPLQTKKELKRREGGPNTAGIFEKAGYGFGCVWLGFLDVNEELKSNLLKEFPTWLAGGINLLREDEGKENLEQMLFTLLDSTNDALRISNSGKEKAINDYLEARVQFDVFFDRINGQLKDWNNASVANEGHYQFHRLKSIKEKSPLPNEFHPNLLLNNDLEKTLQAMKEEFQKLASSLERDALITRIEAMQKSLSDLKRQKRQTDQLQTKTAKPESLERPFPQPTDELWNIQYHNTAIELEATINAVIDKGMRMDQGRLYGSVRAKIAGHRVLRDYVQGIYGLITSRHIYNGLINASIQYIATP